MPSYILTHARKRMTDITLIQAIQELPSGATGTFNSASPGYDKRPLQALLSHLQIDFDPNAGDELIVEKAYDIPTVNVDELASAPVVDRYDHLHTLTQTLDDVWECREAVDWDQAENLVNTIKRTMTTEDLARCPHITEILTYTAEEDDWDSGEVARFGLLIRRDLEAAWPIT